MFSFDKGQNKEVSWITLKKWNLGNFKKVILTASTDTKKVVFAHRFQKLLLAAVDEIAITLYF